MMLKKIVLISVGILFIACGESTPLEEKQELNTSQPKEADKLLNKLGVDIGEKRISLDINKTTDFIKQMEIEMHGRADEIQHKIEKADINFTRDMGIVISDEKVEIDLNKTKKMFQEINILMKEVLLDTNSSKD